MERPSPILLSGSHLGQGRQVKTPVDHSVVVGAIVGVYGIDENSADRRSELWVGRSERNHAEDKERNLEGPIIRVVPYEQPVGRLDVGADVA